MLRTARHAKILEIITQKEIETQEELCEELNRLNYVVTQATISRDIRDLHLFKVTGVEKKYRYAYINNSECEISPKMKSLFRDCVLFGRMWNWNHFLYAAGFALVTLVIGFIFFQKKQDKFILHI
jgi:arginine repressor